MALSADDRLDIHELLARYCWAIDDSDEEAFVELFTPDGCWQGAQQRYCGHAELRRLISELRVMAGVVRPRPVVESGGFHSTGVWPQFLTRHRTVNIVLDEIEEGVVISRSYSLLAKSSGPGTATIAKETSRYKDRIVRCPDGKWRIADRVNLGDFTGI